MIKNSKGEVFYGMHFYPGVAEYSEPGKDPYRVYLNEDTLRSMDPTFAGRPIYVEHVDDVPADREELRKEADGWVIESFFNSADGKHWVKFIAVSDRALEAIRKKMRLSNAYVPKAFGNGGLWNGVSYQKEVTGGEFEHLAIVQNPRYEESVILTPEEFKLYNEGNLVELRRIANSKDQKGDKNVSKSVLNFFKRTKVENAIDPELMVTLPKSGKEVTISQIVNDMDEMEENKKNGDMLAHPEHKVKLHDGSECTVNELVEKHKAMHDELSALKKDSVESESELKVAPAAVEVEGDKKNAEDEETKKKALQLSEDKEKEVEEAKKKNELEAAEAKKKADKLRNAHVTAQLPEAKVTLSADRVAVGKSRYGSN